ncbi:hypothetical protein NMG60_11037007 [Bertholletia excelsa]
MGSGDWFKAIVGLKKLKNGKSKQAKVHSSNKKSNESKGMHLIENELNSVVYGASSSVVNDASSSVVSGASNKNTSLPHIPIEHGSDKNTSPLHIPVEHIAAMRIQAAYRAHMARKALNRMRGTVKFQASIDADSARKQASNTWSHIQSWSRIQAQIRARRSHMVTEERSKQKKLENQLKLEAKLQKIEVEWCGGAETMEEIISRIYQREEAAVKRERAMAYAFSHQWRASSGQYFGQAYYDLGKESWGWSWKERWIAVRPWEPRVHSLSIIPNKAQPTRQGSKESKIMNQTTMKIIVSVEPTLSNGKTMTKGIKSAEKQAPQSENGEAKASKTKA